MTDQTHDVTYRLERFAAETLSGFAFGHTPYQVEHFRTQQQRGNERFEYWQHCVQVRALDGALREAHLDLVEARQDLCHAEQFWPFWNRRRRARLVPRLRHKIAKIEAGIRERENEASLHLDVIERRYNHLTHLTEQEILAGESEYWATRLGRQMAMSHLSRVLSVSEGDIAAVMALPPQHQRDALLEMGKMLEGAKPLLGDK